MLIHPKPLLIGLKGGMMSFRVAANVQGFVLCWSSVFGQPTTEAQLKNQSKKFILMFNSIPSDRYVADKRFAADCSSVSQHSTKPHVVCRLVRRTTACFNCVRGSLEASASRKVLQVLAFVSGFAGTCKCLSAYAWLFLSCCQFL